MNDGYEKLCKDKYLQKEDIVLFESIKIDHDGYDKDGPQSNLYDYYVIIQRNNEILYEIFHREDWFSNELWEYECFTDNPFKNKITEDITKEEDNYVENLIKFFNEKRSNVFEFIKDLKKKKNLKDYEELCKIDYEELCKEKNLQKGDIVLFATKKEEHDGYDQWGPQAYLYDYYVIIQRNNKILYEIFHREERFSNVKCEYECFADNPFKNKITEDITKEEDNYVENLIKFFNEKRSNVFEFIKNLKKK